MKPRPRAVEREVARYLSDRMPHLTPIERIPVLGRTGPDLTVNELGLVIDVKSRLGVPRSHLDFGQDERFWIIPLFYLHMLDITDCHQIVPNSITVNKWYDHMDEWRQEHQPGGITALVLHRPKMPYGRATLIISKTDYRRFQETWNKLLSLSNPARP
jgi:hypothetical protein